MNRETPLQLLFRMRPEIERDVLRFLTGDDVPYATALGWVVTCAELVQSALDVDHARRVRGSDTEKRLNDLLASCEHHAAREKRLRADLDAKSVALALALEERDVARASLLSPDVGVVRFNPATKCFEVLVPGRWATVTPLPPGLDLSKSMVIGPNFDTPPGDAPL